MKVLVFFSVCLSLAIAQTASECNESECNSTTNCRCSVSQGPLGDNLDDYPQLISLVFDEAVTDNLVKDRWSPLLLHLTNPDDEPITATFFVPHEFTDYERVNDLYNYGFEIGVHSITENPLQTYWRNATADTLQEEFGGQRQIISKFANIPIEHVIGVRTPQLQLAGDNTFTAYVNAGFSYDSSWPTLPDVQLFPYTLNYLSTQQCLLGAKCPTQSFAGFWILPINDLNGKNGSCNNLAACEITGSPTEQANWLLGEVNRIRTTTKAPITLTVNSYWFDFDKNSFEGFQLFLNRLSELKDVFLVSQSRALNWMKNPVPLSRFTTDVPEVVANCNPTTCKLKTDQGSDRYMKICVRCPVQYPWIGNPEGNAR